MASMIDQLQRGVCHLWYWRIDADSRRLVAERAKGLLSAEELARARRYLVPDACETFVAARILLRSVLSGYCPLKPSSWRFSMNDWGRPEIAEPTNAKPLRFNISHKPDLVTCLVGFDRELGVDLEDVSVGRPHLLNIASQFFSPFERDALYALPEAQRLDRFYQTWTLKEAYIKARGMGFGIPLRQFSFLMANHEFHVEFDSTLNDDPAAWVFEHIRLGPRHLAAAAIHRIKGMSTCIETRNAAEYI